MLPATLGIQPLISDPSIGVASNELCLSVRNNYGCWAVHGLKHLKIAPLLFFFFCYTSIFKDDEWAYHVFGVLSLVIKWYRL